MPLTSEEQAEYESFAAHDLFAIHGECHCTWCQQGLTAVMEARGAFLEVKRDEPADIPPTPKPKSQAKTLDERTADCIQRGAFTLVERYVDGGRTRERWRYVHCDPKEADYSLDAVWDGEAAWDVTWCSMCAEIPCRDEVCKHRRSLSIRLNDGGEYRKIMMKKGQKK